MKVMIRDIEYFLPEQIVSNEMIKSENPQWDFHKLEKRVGVFERHIAHSDQTALDLAENASRRLLEKNPQLFHLIDAIIFCTQSNDYIMPSNSCLLHGRLGLGDEVLAFDYNLACSGFVYGLAMAQGLIAAKTVKNVLLVTADTYSKYIHPKDKSVRMLFGDGAAATWISASESSNGMIDVLCATSGAGASKFIIPAGGCKIPKSPATAEEKKDAVGSVRTDENIHMEGHGILTFVKEKVPSQVKKILERNQLKIEDIDLVIFHQASRIALNFLNEHFALNPSQIFSNLEKVGNTVSASIPIALRDAETAGRLKRGDKVLLVGFGVGLSYATALMKY